MTSIRKSVKSRKTIINRKAINDIINHSPLCKNAIKELNRVGYSNKNADLRKVFTYNHIMEAVALFCSHFDGRSNINDEVDFVHKLCKCKPLPSLTLKDNEYKYSYIYILNYNTCCINVIKVPNKEYTTEEIENILIANGVHIDECSYMISDNELNIENLN